MNYLCTEFNCMYRGQPGCSMTNCINLKRRGGRTVVTNVSFQSGDLSRLMRRASFEIGVLDKEEVYGR